MEYPKPTPPSKPLTVVVRRPLRPGFRNSVAEALPAEVVAQLAKMGMSR